MADFFTATGLLFLSGLEPEELKTFKGDGEFSCSAIRLCLQREPIFLSGELDVFYCFGGLPTCMLCAFFSGDCL